MLVETEELKRVIHDCQRGRDVWGRYNLYWLVKTDLSEGEVSELRPEGVSLAQEPSRQREQYIKQFILGNSQISLFSSLSNNCPSFLQWNFYFSQVIFYENACSCAYFTQLDTSPFMRIRSLPESPKAIHGLLQFSFLPPGATLANVSEANSSTLARESKMIVEGKRVSNWHTHSEDEEIETQEVKKCP